jgi:two-component system, NtrC family, response regulator AtoC
MAKVKANILIVEDDAPINEAYQMILSKAGYTVKSTYDGKEALETIKTFKADVILLDLRMPHLDGIGFLKALPEEEKKKTKIVILSNYDMQKEVDEAYKLGAERYILKAWASPAELLQIVKNTLQS